MASLTNFVKSQVLKQGQIPLVPHDTCKKSYNEYCVTNRMRCAGYAEGGVDSCHGDSGGPLVCQLNGKWHVMGVVSWGDENCGKKGRYGVYADVMILKSWIEKTMRENL